MADSIERTFKLESDLVKGRGGVFEVKLDDDLIYSKKTTGRFPEPGEVEALLKVRLAA